MSDPETIITEPAITSCKEKLESFRENSSHNKTVAKQINFLISQAEKTANKKLKISALKKTMNLLESGKVKPLEKQ